VITPLSAATSAPTADAAPPKNIEEAAQQFEAMMLTQMLRSAKESSGEGALSDGDDDSTSSTTMDMANSQFAKMLSQNGGLGLAKLIIRDLKR
jgi:Rod binding domain-containing protein